MPVKIAESSGFTRKSLSALLLIFVGACSHDPVSSVHQALPPSMDSHVRAVPLAPREKVEAFGKTWVISTQGRHTTEIANSVMKNGGNLIDAAIAASFAIGVERPHSTGIGGGGFLIFHEAKSGKNHVFDFRERAPGKAKPDLYLDESGRVIEGKSIVGGLSVAVPGLVRGLQAIHQRFGHLPWKTLVDPAKKLSQTGFEIYPSLAHAINEEKRDLFGFKDSRKTFLHRDGSPKKEGEILIQSDLARSLDAIAKNPESFYTGPLSKRLLKSIRRHEGILTASDLKSYAVKERQPLLANWKGYQIVSMPPPSSGGLHVIQILKMLENDELEKKGLLGASSIHLISSAMQQAFADRAMFLGDPDFVKVPVKELISDRYLANHRARFNEVHARKMSEVIPGKVEPEKDHFETTHLSLMDQEGNVVVSTQTINGYFGSKIVAEGTGIVLNNEMDDFSAKVGAKNLFGATSSSLANQVEAGKTPLSSMSPTIILKDGSPILALGAPGGTRILTAVAQTILNYLVFHQDLYSAIAAPRIHQQWQPDELMIENQALAPEVLGQLQSMGWKIKRVPAQSSVMAVAREGGRLHGVSDPRDAGTAAGDQATP